MTRIRFNPPAPLAGGSKQKNQHQIFLTLDNAHQLFLENTDRVRIKNSDIRKTLVRFILATLLEKDFSFIKKQASLEKHSQLENPITMIETESFLVMKMTTIQSTIQPTIQPATSNETLLQLRNGTLDKR